MAALVYAQPDDLTPDWLPAAPDNAKALIRQASSLLRRETRTAVYAVDNDGRPTDPTLIEGFRDVVCAQVAAWAAAGIDPTAQGGGAPTIVTSKSMGGKSVQYAVYERDAAARSWLTTHLCDEATEILARLPLWSGVQVIG